MPLTTEDVQKLNALKDPTNKTVITAQPIVPDAPVQTGSLSADDVQNLKALNTQKFKVSDTGNSVEPVDGWQPAMQTLSKRFNQGVDGLKDSIDGAAVGMGLKTEDQYKQDLLKSGLQTTSEEDDLNTTGFAKFVDVFGGPVAQALPSIGVTLGGVAGGTIALPGAGSLLGGAAVMGTLAFGHAKADGIRRGEDPAVSEVSGIASGMLNGALGFVGVGFTGKAVKDIAAEVITSPPFKEAMIQTGISLSKSMGVNLGAAAISSLGDSLNKYIATRISTGAKPFTIDDATKEFGEAMKTAALVTSVIGAGTAAAGHGLGVIRTAEVRARVLTEYLKAETARIHAENEAQLTAKHFAPIKEEAKTAPLQGRIEQNGKAAEIQDVAEKNMLPIEKETAQLSVATIESRIASLKLLIAQFERELPEMKAKLENMDLHTDLNQAQSLDEIVSDRGAAAMHEHILDMEGELPYLKQEIAHYERALAARKQAPKPKTEKQLQAKADAETLEEAKKQNEEFQDELQRKNLIDEAILAVSITKNAAKEILKARVANKGEPLTPAQELALRQKIFISRDPNEVFNLVAEITEGLGNKLPTSRVSGWSGMDLLNHLYTVFQYLTPERMYKLADKFDATKAVDARDIIQTNLTNKLYGHVQEATGLNRKAVERLAIKAQKTKLKVTAMGADGVDHTMTLTIGKIQAFLALMKNKDAQVALTDAKEGNNFTLEATHGEKSTQAAFKAALKAADKDNNFNKMLVGIANFYEEMGPRVKTFHDKRNPNNPLSLQKNYGQQVVREGANEIAPGLTPEIPGMDVLPGESKGTGKGNSAPPGMVKPREALKARIMAQDAFSSAQGHARKVANYFAFSDPSKLWVDLLGNVTFRHYVSSHFGNRALKGLEADYEYVVHGSPQAETEVGPIINFLLNAKAVQVLVGNVLYVPKHALTVANGLLYKYNGKPLPADALLKANLDLTLHPSKAKEILGRAEIDVRYTRKDYLATASGSGKMTKAIGATIVPGDKLAVAVIVHAIEDFVYEQTGDRELAKEEAAKGMEQVLASNSTAKSTPMSRGLVERYITQFSGPEAVVARNVRTAWRIAANHPTHENLVNAFYTDFVGRTALVMFTLPTVVYVYALAKLGPHKQNDAKLKNALWGVAEKYALGAQFPLPGLVVPAIGTIIANQLGKENFYVAEKGVPGLENTAALKSAATEAHNMIRGKEHKTMHNVLQMMINAIQAASLPVPLSQARAAKDILPTK